MDIQLDDWNGIAQVGHIGESNDEEKKLYTINAVRSQSNLLFLVFDFLNELGSMMAKNLVHVLGQKSRKKQQQVGEKVHENKVVNFVEQDGSHNADSTETQTEEARKLTFQALNIAQEIACHLFQVQESVAKGVVLALMFIAPRVCIVDCGGEYRNNSIREAHYHPQDGQR